MEVIVGRRSKSEISRGVALLRPGEIPQEDPRVSRPRRSFAEGSPDALSQGLGDPKTPEIFGGALEGEGAGGRKPREKSAPNQPLAGGGDRGPPPPTP